MAITASLRYQGHNFLRYLLTQDGGEGTTLAITTTGAASPDLLTDSVSGPVKNLAKAFTNGFAGYAAGALTANQATALWLSRNGIGLASFIFQGPGIGPTAIARITPRTTGDGWLVDAGVDGPGHPVINITGPVAASTAYLDIEVPGTIGVD
jgi:hypothetical protein